MIKDTLTKIEEQIQNSASLTPERRQELMKLLETLKSEVSELAETNADDAQSIANFTQLSAHEATRSEKKPELLQHSLGGLSASVASLEKSHPRLFQAVQSITDTLSNLGI